jgi:uncharacterized membrane protein
VRHGTIWIARHWLALANGIILLMVIGSAAIPALMAAGFTRPAGFLFGSYHLVCQQLPGHSFFLFGYQMALCQRDLAIYAAMGMAGLVFGLSGRRWAPLPWRWYLLLLLPLAVDGTTQLFGLRDSNWQLRLLTGGLFGAATVWIAYPYLEDWAREILRAEPSALASQGSGLRTQD